ncbi:hypothetical protein BRADI_1g07970v3 [Brachypodium distachyon]|uniref:WRKY domain-containing protein n=2 Tax=Brachypodium distachyon TaxID=15368 RepID=I1GN29_BRADI|nr:hypothetical protein BRADI_1g07970v3 [Brachypodium distachyon]
MADRRGDAMRQQQQPFGSGQERVFDGGGGGGPAFGGDYDHASSSYMALLGTGVNPQPLPPPPAAWAVEEVTSATAINLTPQFSMANYAPPSSSSYQQNPASFASPFAAAALHNPYQPPSTTYFNHADPPPQWPPRAPSSSLPPPRGNNFALQHEQQQQQQSMQMQLLRALGRPHQALASAPAAAAIEQPGKDGYNWRKYGQKQLKDAESPRSYYKCTREACPVKKIVERSFDGCIKEITYKGRHTHPRPPHQPRRGGDNVADAGSGADAEEEEEEHGDQLPSDDEDNGQEGQDRTAGGGAAAGQRVVKKHKITLQTPSEVDLLDDGYRWRKYGQKVVKGNPRPRSYYKCTAENCNVRKQIERASSNPSCVLTTYTGRHSHHPPGRATGGSSAVPTPSTAIGNTARQLKEESRD